MLAAILAVVVHLALPPEQQPYDERYRNAAASATRLLEDWFGAIDRDEITLVHRSARRTPDDDGAVVVDMRWPVSRYLRTLENDVVSALSRRYWSRRGPGSSDDAWLAEGLAEYSRARMMETMFPEGRPMELRLFGGHFSYALRDRLAPVLPDSSNRAALAFVTLERYIGWSALQQALGEFAPAWRSGTAGLPDLKAAINNAAGRDLSWLYAEAFDSRATYDFAIDQLTTEPAGQGTYRTVVVARRLGTAAFPGSAAVPAGPFAAAGAIDIEVRFGGDEPVRERWDGRAETVTYEYESSSPATSAAIDPDDVIALDVRRANNQRDLSSRPDGGSRTQQARWLTWVQDLLVTYSFFM